MGEGKIGEIGWAKGVDGCTRIHYFSEWSLYSSKEDSDNIPPRIVTHGGGIKVRVDHLVARSLMCHWVLGDPFLILGHSCLLEPLIFLWDHWRHRIYTCKICGYVYRFLWSQWPHDELSYRTDKISSCFDCKRYGLIARRDHVVYRLYLFWLALGQKYTDVATLLASKMTRNLQEARGRITSRGNSV